MTRTMGSSCSSGSKKDKSKKKSKKNGSEQDQEQQQGEHRGSNASNSSTYVYRKTAEEAQQFELPSGVQHASPSVRARVERVDSTSISSPMSPAQFAQQSSKAEAPTGRNLDLALLSDHVRDLVTGHVQVTLDHVTSVFRRLRVLVCFQKQTDATPSHLDQLASMLQATRDRYSAQHQRYDLHVLPLDQKLDTGAWRAAFDADARHKTLTVVIVVLSGDAAAAAVPPPPPPPWTALPKTLPAPSAKNEDLSTLLNFYLNDCNSLLPEASYTLRPAEDVDACTPQELWTELVRLYPLECLFGWNWALRRICSDDLLIRNSICICHNFSPASASPEVQKLLQKVNDKSILKFNNEWSPSSGLEERLLPVVYNLLDAAMLDASLFGATTIPTSPLLSISKHLYEEMAAQQGIAKVMASNLEGGDHHHHRALSSIKSYVQVKTSHPLVLFGDAGCGRTTAMALACRLCPQWVPEAHVVYRFFNFTPQSRSLHRLLGSVVQQISFLLGEHRSSSLKAFDLPNLLQQLSPFHPLIIMLDGLESVELSSHLVASPITITTTTTTSSSSPPQSPRASSFDWVPTVLPDNVWLVLTAAEPSDFCGHLKATLPPTHCVSLDPLPEAAAHQMLRAQMQLRQRTLTNKQFEAVENTLRRCPTPLFTQLVSHCAIFWTSLRPPHTLSLQSCAATQADALLEAFEEQAGIALRPWVHLAFGYLLLSKHGLARTEMAKLLRLRGCSQSAASMMYELIRELFEPPHLFAETVVGGDALLYCVSATVRRAAEQRYAQSDADRDERSKQLRDFWEAQPTSRRRLDELPRLCGFDAQRFVFDWNWVRAKISASSVEEVLEDVDGAGQDVELQTLREVLRDSIPALSYDADQFLSQMHARLTANEQCPHLKQLLDATVDCPPVPCLLSPQAGFLAKQGWTPDSTSAPLLDKGAARDSFTVYRIKDSPSHFALLHEANNEISVWNMVTQRVVRRIGGVPQPRDMKFIDRHRAVILCNRELCIYDLNRGRLVVKLKGVMNQKMAYYDLHGADHVVALSRNRMYVNMMNLSSGDCVATFKVGEDRFLNSLLVSANGNVCVCGDETQKPFPLLVWDLVGRKLLYDLRIPNHDFVTSLSAITNDGHYVVCVCQEVSDPTPNFIIVYDLQNGTLFKKWKPEVSTCSVAISSDGGCVVTGLVNSTIFVWDLFTGTCRHCLQGHTAPVTFVSLDKWGRRCLTADLPQGRDLAVRLWDLSKGICLASLMVDEKPVACELTEDGGAVVLGLSGARNIVCLLLVTEDMTLDKAIPPSPELYGDEECEDLHVELSA